MVPVDLFTVAIAALAAADYELNLIAETPVPLTDEINERLVEREVLVDAMKAAPEDWKPRLRELYVTATLSAHAASSDVTCPVLPEVRAQLDEAREVLRRAALVDALVAGALRDAAPGWAA